MKSSLFVLLSTRICVFLPCFPGAIYASVSPSLPFSSLPFFFPPLSPFFPPPIYPSPNIQGTSYLCWSDRGKLMSHFSIYFSLIMGGFHSLLIGLLAISVSFYVNCLFFPLFPCFCWAIFFFFTIWELLSIKKVSPYSVYNKYFPPQLAFWHSPCYFFILTF